MFLKACVEIKVAQYLCWIDLMRSSSKSTTQRVFPIGLNKNTHWSLLKAAAIVSAVFFI